MRIAANSTLGNPRHVSEKHRRRDTAQRRKQRAPSVGSARTSTQPASALSTCSTARTCSTNRAQPGQPATAMSHVPGDSDGPKAWPSAPSASVEGRRWVVTSGATSSAASRTGPHWFGAPVGAPRVAACDSSSVARMRRVASLAAVAMAACGGLVRRVGSGSARGGCEVCVAAAVRTNQQRAQTAGWGGGSIRRCYRNPYSRRPR